VQGNAFVLAIDLYLLQRVYQFYQLAYVTEGDRVVMLILGEQYVRVLLHLALVIVLELVSRIGQGFQTSLFPLLKQLPARVLLALETSLIVLFDEFTECRIEFIEGVE
jgi:hypothetical protein